MERPPVGANNDLRDFLRSRRARLTPDQVGLQDSGGRRVPELRREEVAQLAGVSVDYYVRLERGRTVNVSKSVLDALARALCLSETERGHLFAVARPSGKRTGPIGAQQVRPGLQRVLDSVFDLPAIVLGRRLDVLASNGLAEPSIPTSMPCPVETQHGALHLPR